MTNPAVFAAFPFSGSKDIVECVVALEKKATVDFGRNGFSVWRVTSVLIATALMHTTIPTPRSLWQFKRVQIPLDIAILASRVVT